MDNRPLTERLRSGFGGMVPPVCDEAANEIERLKALIGTIRDLTGCEVRNVDDVSPEQHCREIMARFNALSSTGDTSNG